MAAQSAALNPMLTSPEINLTKALYSNLYNAIQALVGKISIFFSK
jgi:hypothetical protein